MFQHFVRLVKKLAVKAIEIASVMRVEFLSAEGLDPGGDACALVTHMKKVKSNARSLKSKVVRENANPCNLMSGKRQRTGALHDASRSSVVTGERASVLDCGGKAIAATPLWDGAERR
jgi:hypothetical protein